MRPLQRRIIVISRNKIKTPTDIRCDWCESWIQQGWSYIHIEAVQGKERYALHYHAYCDAACHTKPPKGWDDDLKKKPLNKTLGESMEWETERIGGCTIMREPRGWVVINKETHRMTMGFGSGPSAFTQFCPNLSESEMIQVAYGEFIKRWSETHPPQERP